MRLLFISAGLVSLLSCVAWAQDFGNVETVVTGLTEPVSLSPVPGDDSRLILAERGGRLRTISVQTDALGNKSFTLLPQPFLDLAALDATHPFFKDGLGTPLRDQSGTIVPRLVRHGGAPVPFNSAMWLPSRQVEQGFYSVAFAPDYAISGLLYVNYNQSDPNTDPADAVPDGAIDWTYFSSGGNYCTQNGRSAIVEFRRDATDPDRVDPASERLVLAVPKPYTGHNGGTLRFGPDGMLWFGLGDGGSLQDDENRAVDPHQLFGKMLRVDVASGIDGFPADPLRNYAVPTTNPYANGVGGAPEVLARGLRNPWQWSFDRWNGDLWIGDVGNNLWEEIDHVPWGTIAGRNFGWRAREGNRATGFDLGGFDPGELTAPVYAYPHSPPPGQPDAVGYASWQTGTSTAGGLVYRGNAIRPWRGRFLFADTYSWRLWSARVGTTGAWSDLQDWSFLLASTVGGVTPPPIRYVVSIAQDNDGEVYIVEYVSGRVRRIVPQGPQPQLADVGVQGGIAGTDGNFDNNDFIVFIEWFFNGDPRADMGKQGGLAGVDQRLDNNDFIVFIDAFFSGN
ncbi:MAG: PQQ-dependent sugar dehydrogenase [Phycisphaerales bacterium]|nr:PQQ-dependent sugar dehydrogenase [Phycisphaerales bacterium]